MSTLRMNGIGSGLLCGVTAAAMLLTAGPSTQAAMMAGDSVVVNFTKDGNTVGGNWNEAEAASGQFFGGGTLVADLIRVSDGAATGVALDVPSSIGIGGLDADTGFAASFPQSGAVPDNAKENLTFHSGTTSFTFTGLDDALVYNLSFLSAHNNGNDDRNANDWVIQSGLPGEQSILVDPDDNLVHTFSGIATDGSGNITLSNTNSSGADAQHINAMELTAVIPEPGSFALLAAGGLLICRRCRR